MTKTPYRPADDGPGIQRLRSNERFEALRLETMRLQQEALESAALLRLRRDELQRYRSGK